MAFFPLRIFAALLSATVLLFALPCAAQKLGPTGGQFIFGVVKDSLGRPMVSSTITLKSDLGKIIRVTTTDGNGFFRLRQPRAGTYSIGAQSANFMPATVVLIVPPVERHSDTHIVHERVRRQPTTFS